MIMIETNISLNGTKIDKSIMMMVFGQYLHHGKRYDSIATVGETGVWLRSDFQSGSRVLKKVF